VCAQRTGDTRAYSGASHGMTLLIVSTGSLVRAQTSRDTDHHLNASRRPIFVIVRKVIPVCAWRMPMHWALLQVTSLEGSANFQCGAIDRGVRIAKIMATTYKASQRAVFMTTRLASPIYASQLLRCFSTFRWTALLIVGIQLLVSAYDSPKCKYTVQVILRMAHVILLQLCISSFDD